VEIIGVVDRALTRSRSRALQRQLCDQRNQLVGTLTEILGSPSWQESIAGRSYWHPNGFVKLVLADHPQAGQVRLHVWPDLPDDHDIHDHGWPYESIVLMGELTEIAFRESAFGEGRPMWRHSYRQIGLRRFAVVGPTSVRLAEHGGVRVHSVGEVSGGSPDHIHRFFATLAPAATLLRVGPIVRQSSYVYRPTAEPPHVIAPRPTTRDDVREWIGYLAEVVEPSLPASSARADAATPGPSRPNPARIASGLPWGMYCTGTPRTSIRGMTPPCSASRPAMAVPMPPSR
jgi:hypothetical protein